jgi:hypothetical protein
MSDYLSSLARQAVHPTTEVRPQWPQFGTGRTDEVSRLEEPPTLEEAIDIEAPVLPPVVGMLPALALQRAGSDRSPAPSPRARPAAQPDQRTQQPNVTPSEREAPFGAAVTTDDSPAAVAVDAPPVGPTRPAAEFETQLGRQLVASAAIEYRPVDPPSDVRPEPAPRGNTPDRPAAPQRHDVRPDDPGHRTARFGEQVPPQIVVNETVIDTFTTREVGIADGGPPVGHRRHEIIPLVATVPLPAPGRATPPLTAPAVSAAAETVVHVTIGRVEVRAAVGQPRSRGGPAPAPRPASKSLEDYLRGDAPGRAS